MRDTPNSTAIQGVGLVTSVGLSAPASCAAFRARLTNPSETRFADSEGAWIMAHAVPMEAHWRGLTKLTRMAAMAIEEAMGGLPKAEWPQVPLLLCLAEHDRPGRADGLDDSLFSRIESELGVRFAAGTSAIVAKGRVGVAVAMAQARTLAARHGVPRILVAAVDSLLSWPTLSHYEQKDRLLTDRNSNGFMPGEAAGALLIGKPSGAAGELLCTGIGFAREDAHIDSEQPLRGEGLSQAIKAALADAGRQMHDMDLRITDNSGEQYYFKEASLALSRTLRVRKEEFDIWHPAECTGEIGAASGTSLLAAAKAACDKRYAMGSNILVHLGNDAGHRAALTLQYRTSA
jgi:3-oxoacyl-[acyl-carrier-protein] synthase I